MKTSAPARAGSADLLSLAELERRHIEHVLEATANTIPQYRST